MKKNEKKKTNKKLLSAFGMFMLSGAMLGTATYAWFTMSREVELTNIKMTATVPEDMQIALGEIVDGSETNSLANSASILATTSTDEVKAPADQDDSDPFDWSNTADISAYYKFGKLIPASSISGENVYFTPDATGVGKTLGSGAQSYTAVKKDTAGTDMAFGSGSSYATAHVKTATDDAWGGSGTSYRKASAYDTTNDDGYYIDIPVWLRTSSTGNKSVYVSGFIKADTNPSSGTTTSTDDLYKAVRVAILNDSYEASGGLVDLSDASDGSSYPATRAAINSILDSTISNTEASLGSGTHALIAGNASATASASYDSVVVNNGTTSVATLSGKGTGTNTSAQYGPATKIIVRVWLEGGDVNCWNANAGQDWSISLKFGTSELPAN